MSALEMRLKLDRLRRHHNIELKPVSIPLSAPTERAQVLSGGPASTTVDLQRQKFHGFCFGAIHKPPFPPIYFRHQQERGEVGQITNLQYDTGGNLIVTATVNDPIARRANAWSIGISVRSFEIMDADSPSYSRHYFIGVNRRNQFSQYAREPCVLGFKQTRRMRDGAAIRSRPAVFREALSGPSVATKYGGKTMTENQIRSLRNQTVHYLSYEVAIASGMTGLHALQQFVAGTYRPHKDVLVRLAHRIGFSL